MLGVAVVGALPQLCSLPVYLAGAHANAGNADSLPCHSLHMHTGCLLHRHVASVVVLDLWSNSCACTWVSALPKGCMWLVTPSQCTKHCLCSLVEVSVEILLTN